MKRGVASHGRSRARPGSTVVSAVLFGLVAVGCSDDAATTSTTSPKESTIETTIASTIPGPPTTTTGTEPGIIAPPTSSSDRFAPDVTTRPLQFGLIRAFADSQSKAFSIAANVTNTSEDFLNGAQFTWRVTNVGGDVLDNGRSEIVTLAPGETTSISITGSNRYDDAWTAVRFTYSPE